MMSGNRFKLDKLFFFFRGSRRGLSEMNEEAVITLQKWFERFLWQFYMLWHISLFFFFVRLSISNSVFRESGPTAGAVLHEFQNHISNT